MTCTQWRIGGLATTSEELTLEDRAAQLERERRLAPYAAAAAVAAAAMTVGGLLWFFSVNVDAPAGNAPAFLRFMDDHGSEILLARSISALGVACLALVAFYLWIATRFRRREAPGVILVTGLLGPLLMTVSTEVIVISLRLGSSDFVQREYQTIAAAEDVVKSVAIQVAEPVFLVGILATGFWFLLGSLNAMRAGLLTRGMGIIGIGAGPLLVLSGSVWLPVQVLIAFWLLAVAGLVTGLWPGGRPEAWRSGTAVPWPSARERREMLEREREEGAAGARTDSAGARNGSSEALEGSGGDDPEPEKGLTGGSRQGARRRKRKRRRKR